MKLSTRVRYGVRALIGLAKLDNGRPMSLREIAANQQISPKYLEQMVTALRVAGLVRSIRGAEGGYRLARPADQITVWDIYAALDVATNPVHCDQPPCKRLKICAAQKVWAEMSHAIETVLKSHDLAQLAQTEQALTRKS